MKTSLLLILVSLSITLIARGQTVSNLLVEQSGRMIDVYYDLSGNDNESFEVKLYCSQDGGKTWGKPLQYVTGAVGEKVKQGFGKKITWDVLKETEELTGEIKFKIDALPHKIEVKTVASNCRSFTVTHTAGSVAPVTKTVTYGVVETDLSGIKKCWITQNLGADRQATAATDATEASAGWYWQFNRNQGYKNNGNKTIPDITWTHSINENCDWLPINDPCALLLGSGWRLPTAAEWENSDVNGGWDNYNETFASELKLHAAGCLSKSYGSLDRLGSSGYYWSSSKIIFSVGRNLSFGSKDCSLYNNDKAYGFTTRCLRDL